MTASPSSTRYWVRAEPVRLLARPPRCKNSSDNALALANALEASPHVLAVHYPGLASYPQRRIAIKQHRNALGGGMLSFRIEGWEGGGGEVL